MALYIYDIRKMLPRRRAVLLRAPSCMHQVASNGAQIPAHALLARAIGLRCAHARPRHAAACMRHSVRPSSSGRIVSTCTSASLRIRYPPPREKRVAKHGVHLGMGRGDECDGHRRRPRLKFGGSDPSYGSNSASTPPGPAAIACRSVTHFWHVQHRHSLPKSADNNTHRWRCPTGTRPSRRALVRSTWPRFQRFTPAPPVSRLPSTERTRPRGRTPRTAARRGASTRRGRRASQLHRPELREYAFKHVDVRADVHNNVRVRRRVGAAEL